MKKLVAILLTTVLCSTTILPTLPAFSYSMNEKIQYGRNIQTTSEIKMYTDQGDGVYFGAKNEPETGILYGTSGDGLVRNMGEGLPDESMVLLYQELGGEYITIYENVYFPKIQESNIAVEYALNCPQEAENIRNIESYQSFLERISATLNKIPDVPIYLRFAAEFDVWTDMVGASEYIYAFQYVSKFFKEHNPNVAMVWSPNQVANLNIDIHAYYPGDEYVDWVGMSSYINKYFVTSNVQDEMVFTTGDYSNPVLAIKYIVDAYGDRKPIMIAESGIAHVTKDGEDLTDFALQRINQFYEYIPMVYPQVKLIAYFDKYMSWETQHYHLSGNEALKEEYLRLTQNGSFIQDEYTNEPDFVYREITNNIVVGKTFPVSTYAHMYLNETANVKYYVNDAYVGESSQIPFTVNIDASAYVDQNITLKSVATGVTGQSVQTQAVIKVENQDIIAQPTYSEIFVDGEQIAFEAYTLFDNNYFKLRDLAEVIKESEKAFAITWDGENQAINLITGQAYESVGGELAESDWMEKVAVESKATLLLDGEKISLSAYTINDNTYFKLRDIYQIFDVGVSWNGEANRIEIDTTASY